MQKYKQLLLVVIFLALLLLVFQLSGLREHFNLKFLQEKIQENRVNGLLLFVVLFSLGNLIQIPGWIFLAAAVLTLGQIWGGAATYIAALISCALTFILVRALGGNALRQIDHTLAVRLLKKLDAHPIRSIVLLRVLFQTIPALNYTLALSGVRFRDYMLGTIAGLPLPLALYCLGFDYLANVFKFT